MQGINLKQYSTQAIGAFIKQISLFLPKQQIITDYSRRYAYGTDASFYRLTPQAIVVADDQRQISQILTLAKKLQVAITFRAAGTSLSGQAITDSVLLMLSDNWRHHQVLNEGKQIKLQPDLIGSRVNQILVPYGRKIGPDPASINSCKIGGIVANNSSGMCCGVKQNTYHTIADVSLIFADGTRLDTSCQQSRDGFKKTHGDFLKQLEALATQAKADEVLVSLITHKYRLKNTTGYGINSLIDFENGFDILKHLIVGSEGSLAFIADVTYHTVADHHHKVSGLFIFDDVQVAAELVVALQEIDVAAAELLDKRALLSVAHHEIMPTGINKLPEQSAAMLIELTADSADTLATLQQNVEQLIEQRISALAVQIGFSTDKLRNEALWNIRKGTFPAVGANRALGTTVIIEDVSFPVNELAQGIARLQALFAKYDYHEAIIFGHALVGNLHFVFTQAFDSQEQIDRYDAFMQEVVQLVAGEFNGALKAEHGTGRNMAPFVKTEWGEQAYQLMLAIKQLFDPDNILNPGVIINQDPQAHIKNLKLLPKADEVIDKCIECGFCEVVCPSHGLTLSPRQRISIARHMQQQLPTAIYQQLVEDYQYLGIDSCAATGLCSMKCPVGINTGDYVKSIRTKQNSARTITNFFARYAGRHFALVSNLARVGLTATDRFSNIFGQGSTATLFKGLNFISFQAIPYYHYQWPKGEVRKDQHLLDKTVEQSTKKVIYFPSCSGRIFAADGKASDKRSLAEVVRSVFAKAGFTIIIPENINQLCCGMPWASKGFAEQYKSKQQELCEELNQLSEQGKIPIITDASPCALQFKQQSTPVYEVAEFIETQLINHLAISQIAEPIVLHVTCSSKRLGNEQALVKLAKRCSKQVVIPADIECCGFAGDKGFTTPELNAHALRLLRQQIPMVNAVGVSNSRTCEIGLSEHSGISYQSVVYLLDKVSQSKVTD